MTSCNQNARWQGMMSEIEIYRQSSAHDIHMNTSLTIFHVEPCFSMTMYEPVAHVPPQELLA